MLDIKDIGELDENEFEVSEALLKARSENQAMLDIFEKRKKLRSIAVPTDDSKVRLKLRDFGQPITLFGEGPAERRDRLRLLLLSEKESQDVTADGLKALAEEDKEAERKEKEETGEESEAFDEEKEAVEEDYWTPGSDKLLNERLYITEYSLRRAQQRIAIQRKEFDTSLNFFKFIRKDLYADLQTYTNFCSQLVDDRPTSFVAFAPNSKYLATGSFSGNMKVWQVPDASLVSGVKAHEDRVGGVAWHPKSTLSLSESSCNLVSCSSDGSLGLWSLNLNSLGRLEGHAARVSRVAFHPSGRYVGSASFDTTWKLWDLETQTSILTQDGHAAEVYCLAFHLDGSLIGSGGLDGIGKLWDARTGRCILNLKGHLKQVLAMDFALSGYQLVTGSQDNTMKIWDLRQCQSIYTVPAHSSLVSQVKYYLHLPSCLVEKENAKGGRQDCYLDVYDQFNETQPSLNYERGHPITSSMYLVSSGFDGKINIWGEGDFKLIKSLQGHEGKVMSMDISSDSQFIASAGYDRTFKLWASHHLQL